MPVTIGGSGPITGVTSINTTVSDTELGYLDGVTSALQTQINARPSGTTGEWTAFTPTWTANSGSPSIGNGQLSGWYSQIGKTVMYRVYLYGGSTTTWTGNTYRFSLPVTGRFTIGTGAVNIYNANTGTAYVGSVYCDSATNLAVTTNSGFIGATNPATWGANWVLNVFFTYEAA